MISFKDLVTLDDFVKGTTVPVISKPVIYNEIILKGYTFLENGILYVSISSECSIDDSRIPSLHVNHITFDEFKSEFNTFYAKLNNTDYTLYGLSFIENSSNDYEDRYEDEEREDEYDDLF